MADLRIPVTTLADLATLDEGEIIEGYWDGFHGELEPGNNRSRSYWHGWRNGAVDGKHMTKDDAQAALCREYVRSMLIRLSPTHRG